VEKQIKNYIIPSIAGVAIIKIIDTSDELDLKLAETERHFVWETTIPKQRFCATEWTPNFPPVII